MEQTHKCTEVVGGNTGPPPGRHRNWCFTSWIKPDFLDATKVRYAIYQKERGEEKGKEHYQGYVEFKNPIGLGGLKKLDEKTHWEIRKGSQIQAIEYCSKITTRIEEPIIIGSPKEQGKRNDLLALKESIDAKENYSALHFECYVKYSRGIEKYQQLQLAYKFSKTEREVQTWWLWGDTGCGKSRTARAVCKDPFILPVIKKGNVWYDGYEGQDELIIDDLDFGQIDRGELLRILDRYPVQVPIKGGFTWAGWTKVFITSNFKPEVLYNTDAAIMRRINYIVPFKNV